MAITTDNAKTRPTRRSHRLLWFVGLWLASVLTVIAAAVLLRLMIGALYQI